jgi:hypothetical protein
MTFAVGVRTWRLQVVCAFVAVMASVEALAQARNANPPDVSAQQLVRQTVANELAANNSPVKHMFRSRKQTAKGSQTRLYIETRDCMAAMLIAVNDQPLNDPQRQGETNHLNWLAGSPDQQRKKLAREKEDADRTLRIVKAMPDAFQFEYAGTEMGDATMGREGSQLMRLKFRPNPSYSPPSRVEQVLSGMEGYVLIDPVGSRLAKIDGTLFREVSFGWGIIGHLDKGGRFLVRQADLGDGSWDITELKLNITGKILLFKSISMMSDEVFSDFQKVPEDLTFVQAVKMLQAEEAKLSHQAPTAEASEAKKTPQ